MKSLYNDSFSSWSDVIEAFAIKDKEPKWVYAWYDSSGYDGWAKVYYKLGKKYYIVDGSHCSCYGLEGQWDPVEYENKKLFLDCLARGDQEEYKTIVHLLKSK